MGEGGSGESVAGRILRRNESRRRHLPSLTSLGPTVSMVPALGISVLLCVLHLYKVQLSGMACSAET